MKIENKVQASPTVPKPGAARKRSRFWNRSRQERVFTMPYMLLSIAGVLTFYIIPFAVVIYYALIDNTTNGNFVGIDNFVKLFDNNAFRLALKNTGIFSLTAVPFAVVLSLGLAVLLEQNLPGKSVFRTIFLSPMIVPAASVILIWQVLFDYNGVINDITALFGADPVEWMKSEFGYVVVVLLFLWKNIG
ncbi:MAG: sugar ABC transporter permease, partial [Clostridia bacterium]|nr:sugar ABC transporter permease [Clostridia bacterium]